MVKVLLRRRVRPENYHRLLGLLNDLRAAALHQAGYLSGETLVRGEDPIEVLAIGTWLTEECWRAWSTRQERIEIEDMIDSLLEGKVDEAVYHMSAEEL